MKVVLVNYMNSRPFLRGLEKYSSEFGFEIIEAFPSDCARIVESGDADIGLVPIGGLPYMEDVEIISDYCISCNGSVQTVALYSEQNIDSLEEIYLDYQSLTSVRLLKILCRDYWKISPRLLKAEAGYEDRFKGTTGGLIIGDRTVVADRRYPYKYDLGKAWKEHTDLPFCFAVWVTKKSLPLEELIQLNKALEYGVSYVPHIIDKEKESIIDLKSYFSNYIEFNLNEQKKEAINLFNQKLNYKPAVFQYNRT